MKQRILLMTLVLTSMILLSQTTIDLEALQQGTTFKLTIKAFLLFFLPAVAGEVAVLFADARKYFNTPEWSWDIFFLTKIRPFLWTLGVGTAIYFIALFVPWTTYIIETMSESALTPYTASAVFGAAAALVDGFTKKAPPGGSGYVTDGGWWELR